MHSRLAVCYAFEDRRECCVSDLVAATIISSSFEKYTASITAHTHPQQSAREYHRRELCAGCATVRAG